MLEHDRQAKTRQPNELADGSGVIVPHPDRRPAGACAPQEESHVASSFDETRETVTGACTVNSGGRQHSEDAEGSEIKGAARALREFGSLAWWAVPIYGVFVPNDDEVSIVVERVAAQHLGLEQARAEFRTAVASIEPFDQRDAIESAHGHVRSVTEEAYFYAGLAFGVTMTSSA